MADVDDDRWLERIAGSESGGMAPEGREATCLRAVLRARENEARSSESEIESGLQRLKLRLRREGLLEATPRARSWGGWSLAASVLVAVASLELYRQGIPPADEGEPLGVRGGHVQQLFAREPARKADEIADDLRALDITVIRRDAKDASMLEALVQNRADPRLAAALVRHGLETGVSGPVQVRITRRR